MSARPGGYRPTLPEGGRPIALVWAATFVLLSVTQALARRAPAGDRFAWDGRLVDGWVQFDGPEYLAIARDGYQAHQLVWFPVYPLLVRAAGTLVPDLRVAAVLVTVVAGAVAAWAIWRWSGLVGLDPRERQAGMALLLLYPYGWFQYGAVYSDAVFLAAAGVAFWMVEERRFLAAGVAAAVATAGRPSGSAVLIGVLVLTLERQRVLEVVERSATWVADLGLPTALRPGRLNWASAAPLAGLVGLAAWGGYQWSQWGSPVRFVSEQARYHSAGAPTMAKRQFFDAWYQGFDGRHLATTTAQAVLLAVVIMAVPAVGRRFGWGYGCYVLALAGLPLVSVSTFMGVGRYLMPAFPVAFLFGSWLSRRPWWLAVWLAGSSVLLVTMTAGFARSWYLT